MQIVNNLQVTNKNRMNRHYNLLLVIVATFSSLSFVYLLEVFLDYFKTIKQWKVLKAIRIQCFLSFSCCLL